MVCTMQNKKRQLSLGSHILAMAVGILLCLFAPQAMADWAPPRTVDVLFTQSELRQNPQMKQLLTALKQIEKGGKVDTPDADKRTPLILAAMLRHRLAICYLVAKKASVTAKDKHGKTALDYTTDEPLRRLLKACADEKKPLSKDRKLEIKLADESPEHALRMAVATWGQRRRCADILDLVKYGVPLNDKDEDYVPYLDGELPDGFQPEKHPTGLPLGCFVSSPEHIALLVRLGWSDLNRKHPNGSRFVPLPACIDEYSEPEDARLLLTLGLDTSHIDTRWLLAVLLDDTDAMREMLRVQPSFRRFLLRVARSAAAVKLLLGTPADSRVPNVTVDDYRCQVYGIRQWGRHANLLEDAVRFCRGAEVVSALLESGVEMPQQPNNANLLHLVARAKVDDGDVAAALIKAGVNIEQKEYNNHTPLHIAVSYRNLKVVQALLKAKANPNAQDNILDTPLHITARSCMYSTIRELIVCREKVSNLPKIVTALAKAGADVNARNKDGFTTLRLAIERGGMIPQSVLALLEAGAQSEKNSLSQLEDAFKTSVEFDRADPEEMGKIAIALVKAGAELNKDTRCKIFSVDQYKFIRSTISEPPVHMDFIGNSKLLDYLSKSPDWEAMEKSVNYWNAIDRCNTAMVRRMVEMKIPVVNKNGLDLFSRLGMSNDHTGFGTTSEKLHQIIYEGDAYSAEQWTELAKLLAKGGGNPDEGFKRPPFDNDAWRNKPFIQSARVVQAIVAAGGNPNAVNKEGVPVIHNVQTPEAMRAFAAAGANINVRDENGNTPLMRRILTDSPDIFKVLLQLGASTTARNKEGKTVYDLAKEAKDKNNKAIYLDLLRTYGPTPKSAR